MDHLLDTLTRPGWSTWSSKSGRPAPPLRVSVKDPKDCAPAETALAPAPERAKKRRRSPRLPPPPPRSAARSRGKAEGGVRRVTPPPLPVSSAGPRPRVPTPGAAVRAPSPVFEPAASSAERRLDDLRALARRSQASLPPRPDLSALEGEAALSSLGAPAKALWGSSEAPSVEIGPRSVVASPAVDRELGRRRRNWTLFLGASLALAALLGHLTSKPPRAKPPETPPFPAKAEVSRKPAPASPARRVGRPAAPRGPTTPIAARTGAEGPWADADEPPGPGASAERGRGPAKKAEPATRRTPGVGETGEPGSAARRETGSALASKPPSLREPRPAERALARREAPAPTLDVAAGMRSIDAIAASLGACKVSPDQRGRGTVAITFLPSGTVGAVVLEEDPFGGTAARTCAARALARATIPPFEGRPVVVRRGFVVR